MKRKKATGICPLCGGEKRPGTTTFTAELGFGVVVVRKVPATVCSQCGADWISDAISARLEQVVAEARTKKLQVEVRSLSN
jgi:YgiT-type zinc finger domain-containing protein